MDIQYTKDTVSISGENINPALIFECGQTFRFRRMADGAYFGIAGKRPLFVRANGEGIDLYPVTKEEFLKFWHGYFDLDFSYTKAMEDFRKDLLLKRILEEFSGLRLLKQEPFETLISFIISANNNVQRVSGIVERLCETAGQPMEFQDKRFYAFPEPGELAEMSLEQLQKLGAGYRAKYIKQTAVEVAGGFPLEHMRNMEYAGARKELCALSGVGPKVADCVLLFAFQKRNAFPVDTWIKKVLERVYGFNPKNTADAMNFVEQKFGCYGGIAQQYLFHYARMHSI